MSQSVERRDTGLFGREKEFDYRQRQDIFTCLWLRD
jgi:hypothetical protein